MKKNKKVSLVLLVLIIITLPLLLLGIRQTLNNRSNASAADKLEAEDGTLGGNVTKQSDTNASGGSYVALGLNTPVMTNQPTPITSNDPQWAQDLKSHMTTLRNGTWTNVTAPSTIPHDGITSSSTAFNNWISTLPAGTKAIVPSGWKLLFDGDNGIDIEGKNRLWLILSGVTIYINTTGASNFSSSLLVRSGTTDLIIDGGTFIGQLTEIGNPASWSQINEHINGYIGSNASFVELNGTSWLSWRGWPIFSGVDSSNTIQKNLWLHNINTTGGETSVAIVAGENVLVENSSFSDAYYFAIDLEPDHSLGHIRHVLIQNNTFRRWGWKGGNHNYYFFAANPGYSGPPWSDLKDIIVRNNQIPEAEVSGQGMRFFSVGPMPKSDLVFTGNVSNSPKTLSGGGSEFNNVNNLTIIGNTQKTLGGVPMVDSDTNPLGIHTITPNNTQ